MATTGLSGPGSPGVAAAVSIGEEYGLTEIDPVLIQETNRTVVWLRPHAVVAKVATRPRSDKGLLLEHLVAKAVHAVAGPVAPPLPGTAPRRHAPTDFLVSLWERIDHDSSARAPGAGIGRSLLRLHQALATTDLDLPDFRFPLHETRRVLGDEATMALATDDLSFLREVFDALLPHIDDLPRSEHALHGEPHEGNILSNGSVVRWVDFENACRGPREWDLAFLPDDARREFEAVDGDLLRLLATINSARVATWCSTRSSARFAPMRAHGRYHLDLLRRSWPALL